MTDPHRPAFPYRRLRELAGLTLSELARRAGLSRQNAHRTETAADVRLGTVLRYLRALGGTVTLTVSQGRAWVTWRKRTTTPPTDALLIDMPDDTDTEMTPPDTDEDDT